jgi:type IV fimbrial biogenesis protein FimT
MSYISSITTTPTLDGLEQSHAARARAPGFTLIEMLMTMAIAAILLTIGIPSFRYVTNSNRIAGELNGLLGDLQFARAEAIKEGRTVTVCVSNDGANCANSTTWQSGWIVFSDPTNVGVVDAGETILRVQTTFSSSDTFNASNNVSAITFNREGYAIGMANGTLLSLHDSTNTSAWTRCLLINLSGQMTSQLYGVTTNGVTCT